MRRPRRALAALALCAAALAGIAGSAGCERVAQDPLAPMARLARSGMHQTEERVAKAHRFLADEVVPHAEIQALYGSAPAVEVEAITWSSTPYIAVGAFDAEGGFLGALPRADDALTDLLHQAATGPEVSDLVRIPNTFAFTVGMRQAVPGHDGAVLAALVDVDRVLVQDVLQPLAEAAHGFAFLANGEGNAVLTTLPALAGRALSHFSIPRPEAGTEATATVTIDGRRYDVATARSSGGNGWTVGIGIAAAEPGAGSPA